MSFKYLVDKDYIKQLLGCTVSSVKMFFGGILELEFSNTQLAIGENYFLYMFSPYWRIRNETGITMISDEATINYLNTAMIGDKLINITSINKIDYTLEFISGNFIDFFCFEQEKNPSDTWVITRGNEKYKPY